MIVELLVPILVALISTGGLIFTTMKARQNKTQIDTTTDTLAGYVMKINLRLNDLEAQNRELARLHEDCETRVRTLLDQLA